MQTPPGHGPPPDHLPQALPALQIHGCAPRHSRSCYIHSPPPQHEQEGRRFSGQAIWLIDVGDFPPLDQSAAGRVDQHHTRSCIHLSSALHQVHRPSNDGCAECSVNRPHRHLSLGDAPALSERHSAQSSARAHPTIYGNRTFLIYRFSVAASRGLEACARVCCLWSRWAAVHFLYLVAILVASARYSHRDSQDADDAVECVLVWSHLETGAVAGNRPCLWRNWCRSSGAETGKEDQGASQVGSCQEEGVVSLVCIGLNLLALLPSHFLLFILFDGCF